MKTSGYGEAMRGGTKAKKSPSPQIVFLSRWKYNLQRNRVIIKSRVLKKKKKTRDQSKKSRFINRFVNCHSSLGDFRDSFPLLVYSPFVPLILTRCNATMHADDDVLFISLGRNFSSS